MKIGDVIAQHMAQGRRFEFTETPPAMSGENPSRIYTEIHGCLDMDKLIDLMKKMNPNDIPTFYGWITTWSDSFIRSYVKHCSVFV